MPTIHGRRDHRHLEIHDQDDPEPQRIIAQGRDQRQQDRRRHHDQRNRVDQHAQEQQGDHHHHQDGESRKLGLGQAFTSAKMAI